jgi:hypothetical protein
MPHWRCVALIFPHAIAVVSNTRSWRNAGFSYVFFVAERGCRPDALFVSIIQFSPEIDYLNSTRGSPPLPALICNVNL